MKKFESLLGTARGLGPYTGPSRPEPLGEPTEKDAASAVLDAATAALDAINATPFYEWSCGCGQSGVGREPTCPQEIVDRPVVARQDGRGYDGGRTVEWARGHAPIVQYTPAAAAALADAQATCEAAQAAYEAARDARDVVLAAHWRATLTWSTAYGARWTLTARCERCDAIAAQGGACPGRESHYVRLCQHCDAEPGTCSHG